MLNEKMDSVQGDIFSYQIAMSLAKSMLEQGLITAEDFTSVENKMAEKFNIKNKSLYRNFAG